MTHRLVLVVTDDWYFWSHRIGLAVAARDAGYDVSIATRVGQYGERIRALGLNLINVGAVRGLLSPRANLQTVRNLCAIYRRWNPHIVHHVAIQPIVLGSAAAAKTGVPIAVNAVTGLGTALISRNMKARLIRPFLRPALGWAIRRSGSHTIVQNSDNARFVECLGVRPERISLVPGAGVDVQQFRPQPESEGPFRVTMVSRLLWDKGVREFVDAATLICKARSDVVFTLVGAPDPLQQGHRRHEIAARQIVFPDMPLVKHAVALRRPIRRERFVHRLDQLAHLQHRLPRRLAVVQHDRHCHRQPAMFVQHRRLVPGQLLVQEARVFPLPLLRDSGGRSPEEIFMGDARNEPIRRGGP